MYDCRSQNTQEFAMSYNLCQRNATSMIVLESTEWFDLQHSFLFWTRPKHIPVRIGSQTAWKAVRLDFIDNKDKIIAKDYELHGRCDFLYYALYR